ncbi:hypothetical protein BJ741DRAFT_603300 [Chytriomyces cf. hyalinus JEL632]|nr:hypothetical protein BJ741DRAFT_603300 [Chytriomyces cf. hyalinus JEL632]
MKRAHISDCSEPASKRVREFTSAVSAISLGDSAASNTAPHTATEYVRNEVLGLIDRHQLIDFLQLDDAILILNTLAVSNLQHVQNSNPRTLAIFILWITPFMSDPSSHRRMEANRKINRFLEVQAATSSQQMDDNAEAVKTLLESLCKTAQEVHAAFVQEPQYCDRLYSALQKAEQLRFQSRNVMDVFTFMNIALAVLMSSSTSMDHIRDVRRYAWLVFLCWRGNRNDDLPTQQIAVSQILVFSLMNMPGTSRQSFASVLKSINGPLSGPESDSDWITSYRELAHAWANAVKINGFTAESGFYNTQVVHFILGQQLLRPGKNGQRIEGVPFEVYPDALAPGATGMLGSNLEAANSHFERYIDSNEVEFDFRLLLPAYRMLATPRKPSAASTRSAKSSLTSFPMKRSERSLKTVFARTSVFNAMMPSTPFTARSCVRYLDRRFSVENEKSYFQSEIQKKIQDSKLDPKRYPERIQTLFGNQAPTFGNDFLERSSRIIENLTEMDRRSAEIWAMITPLYIVFMEQLPPFHVDNWKEYKRMLMGDSQFHKSLLFCTFEILCFTFSISNIHTEGILNLLQVRHIDLCIVIDLLVKWETWLTVSVVKRLKEVEERILESAMWSDETVYNLMNDALQKQNTSIHFSRTMEVYSDLVDPANRLQSATSTGDGLDTFKGIQTLLNKCNKLLKVRAKELCDHLHLGEQVLTRANNLMDALLYSECTNQILRKRHIDLIMLCSVYLAAQLLHKPITFGKLIPAYLKQPQASETTVFAVLDESGSQKVDIVAFYRTIFVKCANLCMGPGEIISNPIGGLDIFSPLRVRSERGVMMSVLRTIKSQSLQPSLLRSSSSNRPLMFQLNQ